VAGKWLHKITKNKIIITHLSFSTSLWRHVCYVPLLPVVYAAGWPLDLVCTWLQRERDICPHLNTNLNRTLTIWPVLVITSDCTMPDREEQVTNYPFHEHFSFFFRYWFL